ncbi:PilZ domain-containing protein [Marinobacter daqiaonensis]|uniref:PilZ domain-containing protein n=1 Tax=Marinobacter daqiaonensis TaxID=650891 RepID=A0A1I6GVK4_9GAMM|nr:PilZ domain-containing protein [Marinobacter daqiaonensis]SFR46220.1 PilZ domain-containing protein [Marinobacter daqiaonensis]
MTDHSDPYSFGNGNEAAGQDQRGEFRLVGRAEVRLELESAEPGGLDQARVVEASSSDVSPGGLRVVIPEPLVEGALLTVAVRLDGFAEPCNLTAEVVWCRAMDSGRWQSGMRILETGDGDYLMWMEALAEAMDAE